MFEMVDPLPGALKLKMPGFVIAWSIVDLVMCALRTLEIPFVIAALFLIGRFEETQSAVYVSGCRLILWLEFSTVIAISLMGLTGNIAMLCRRHWAMYFCWIASFLTLISYGVLVWQVMIFFNKATFAVFSMAIIAVTVLIMLRIALLVFNILSIFRARLFFRERDGY